MVTFRSADSQIQPMPAFRINDDTAGAASQNAALQSPTILFQIVRAGLFVVMFLSIAFVKWSAGPLPVRSVLLLACAGLIAVFDTDTFMRTLRDLWKILLLVVVIGALGLVVSFINSAPLSDALRQIAELHIQALVSIIVAYAIALRMGARTVIYGYLGVFAISAVFALGQALNIDFAWQARAMIGHLQGDPPLTQDFYVTRYRALGLSYSPVLFGTEACLAVAALFGLSISRRGIRPVGPDWILVAGSLVIAMTCVATGNRSPLLGIGAFLILYLLWQAPRQSFILLPLMAIAAAVATPALNHIQDAGVRVVRTEDGSSQGRGTLRAYGYFLIGRKPIGYGLTFESMDHWQDFMHQARYMENPLVFRNWPLHNYYLNMLAAYGVLIALFAFFVVPRNRTQAIMWMGYSAYLIHIFFHNNGPLKGDFVFFFLLGPMLVFMKDIQDSVARTTPPSLAQAKGWRSAFVE